MYLGNKTCKSRLQKDRVRKMITVKINGEERQYPQGATYEDVQETDKGLRGYLFYLEG